MDGHGINDPTTAVHALGHSAGLLCELAVRELGPRLLRDDGGAVRVVLRRPDFEELLEVAVAQPRHYGEADPFVLARLLSPPAEVAWSADLPSQREAVVTQLGRLRDTIAEQDFDDAERDRLDDLAGRVHRAAAGRWTPAADRG